MAADIAYLASNLLEGRQVGTAGADSAANFLADRYAQLGLSGAFSDGCSPGVPCDGAYFQPFRVAGTQAQNIAVVVKGTDPTLEGQYVVVGGHVDHLGRSTRGALDPEEGRALRVGADDNASGTAALLELGRRFAMSPAPMSVVLAHFNAEELGLVGSKVFVDEPPIPLDSVALMINLDMVGRLRDGSLLAEMAAGAEPFRELLERFAGGKEVPLEFSDVTEGRSDHLNFERRGVPSIALFTGFHPDYHRVSDTVDKVDLLGLARIVDLTEDLIRAVGVSR